MDIKRFSVHNDSRESQVAGGIRIVDAVLEPLKVLKVLIEGLGPDANAGIWLTHFKGIPVARTISPFDLVYLDKDYRVVHAVALSTDSDFAPFKGLPESALVLPSQSIAKSNTRQGDQFIISLNHLQQTEAPRVPLPSPHAPVTQGAKSLRDLSPTKHFPSAAFIPPPTSNASDSPLENFLASHSMPPRPRPATPPPPAPSPLQASASVTQAPRAEAPPPPPQVLSALPTQVPATPAATRNDAGSRIPKRRPPAPIDARTQAPPVVPSLKPPSAPSPSPLRSAPAAAPIPLPASPPPSPPTFAAQLEAKLTQAVSKPKEQPAIPKRAEPAPQPSVIRDRRRAPQPSPAIVRPPQPPALQPRIASPRPSASAPRPTPGPAKLPALQPDRFVPPRRPQFEPPLPFTNYEGITTEVKESESKAKRLLRWALPGLKAFDPPLKPSDRRRAGRLPTPGLVAYFFTGGAPKPHKIENISVTGFYLNTNERWMPGTIIRMTLQRIGSTGYDPLDSITVHSRVIRWGQNGGGFEFVLSGFLE